MQCKDTRTTIEATLLKATIENNVQNNKIYGNETSMTSASVFANGVDKELKQQSDQKLEVEITAEIDGTEHNLQRIYQQLHDDCDDNALYFEHDQTERGQRLHAAFRAWQDFIVLSNRLVLEIGQYADKYDFDAATPGNGYRSFIQVTNACIEHGRTICAQLRQTRSTLFFRKKYYMKEVEASSQLLSSLSTCLKYLHILHEWSSASGDLFGNGEHSAEELFEKGDTINQYCFYGRCLGFQYGDSIRGVLRFLSIGMAGYSETFYAQDADDALLVKTTRSIWTSGKYLLNPELRARRIVNISQNAKIEFCKSFWFLAESELMHKIPSIVGSSIKVNRMLEIPAQPLQLPRHKQKQENGLTAIVATTATETELTYGRSKAKMEDELADAEILQIPVPLSHLGPGLPISARLLSANRRIGMLGEGGRNTLGGFRGWRKLASASPSILFHCHGGGFVAQSSKSHELYLRDWAVSLDVPILSVDYSLAPEAPFPRALEEVFYAYCWMLRNAQHLGTTAERIICAGDSAGANLTIGLALKCIEIGVRPPDGLFLAYCPTLISFVPSPARLLCLMDPLLPFGFMMRCLRAYAAPGIETLRENAQYVESAAEIRNATQHTHYFGASRRTSLNSPTKSVRNQELIPSTTDCIETGTIALEDNNIDVNVSDNDVDDNIGNDRDGDSSSDTFASASYHSQTVERTDLPSTECDNSSCVSFEDDSQPIVHYPIEINADISNHSKESVQYIDRFLDKYLIDTATVEANESNTTLQNNDGYQLDEYQLLHPTIAKTESEENLLIDTGRELIALDTLQGRFNTAVNNFTHTFNRYTQSYDIHSGSGGSELLSVSNNPKHKKTTTAATTNARNKHNNNNNNKNCNSSRRIQDLRNMDALIARSPSLEFAFRVPKDPFLSPYWASDEWLSQLPQTKILSLDMDPCLDDCVMFAKKLKRLGRPVSLDILKGLPHGFLNFTMLSNEAMEGSKHCIKCLQELLKMPSANNDESIAADILTASSASSSNAAS